MSDCARHLKHNSSTGFPFSLFFPVRSVSGEAVLQSFKSTEDSVLSANFRALESYRSVPGACGDERERNESVRDRVESNRKDKRNRRVEPLLKVSNCPRMAPFAEGLRQKSMTPDGQVMDRSAEGAAGGRYAI